MKNALSIFALLLSTLSLSGNAMAEDGKITLKLQGIRDASGQLRASLYRDPDSFRKEDKAIQVISLPANQGDATLVFEKIPAGRYAIMAYHDDNNDKKLNLRFGMFPTEGYGLSNNPKVMGPPKFNDSAFDVSGPETRLDIRLTY